MTQYSIYGKNRRNMEEAIRERKSFSTSGSFRGVAYTSADFVQVGQLNADSRDAFRADQPQIDYILFSYSTPIAWHTKNGEWHLVAQKFSATTGRHQSAVRAGIGYSEPYTTVGK